MTQPTDLQVITLFVERTTSDLERKIKWVPTGYTWFPYHIDMGDVNSQADGVRRALKTFVKQCMDPEAGGVQNSGRQLKELAEKGNELYKSIFSDKDQNPFIMSRLQPWVRNQAGACINVIADDRTYIPWGLIYDGDPSQLSGEADDVDISHYGDFWCLKYLVSPYYHGMNVWGISNPKPVNLYRLISAVNKGVFTAAEQGLTPTEKDVLNWLRNQFSSTKAFNIFSKGELLNEWKKDKSDVDMLYFYCHADGTSIAFSDSDKLTMHDIKHNLSRDVRGDEPLSPCLIFLNGCSTASGDPCGGFLEATCRDGFCGFIGTEAEVPDLFALRFGLAFLYRFLLECKPVDRTMDSLRRDHWPLSLLYSTYCYPNLRVSQPTDSTGPNVKKFDNFSNAEQLGTNPI